MTVGDMLNRMSSSEITEWMAYFGLQNKPEKKVDTAAVLKAMLGHRVKKKVK